MGRTGSRGTVTQVRVEFLDDQSRSIVRNVKVCDESSDSTLESADYILLCRDRFARVIFWFSWSLSARLAACGS
jgi:hypothetical protein